MENLKERRIAAIVSYSRLIQKKELKTINSLKLINQNYLILKEG